MSNLEHLIENTLNFLAQNPKATYLEIISSIQHDTKYAGSYIDAEEICHICFYVRFMYLRSLLLQINADIKEATGYARNIKLNDLKPILEKHLAGGVV